MTKLIGTDPNQVPSNADLGSAAFMEAKDFLTAKGSSLSAVNSVISKTAVDVFVYDTRKDSDGGAWRKRTQHTSWYNERLNTTIRGSRRDFPAVAVIVATSASGGESKVIIYDADDPALPMWMELSARGSTHPQNPTTLGWYTSGTPTVKTIFALNGILTCGFDGGINQVKFVSDSFRIGYSTNSYVTSDNISQRENKNIISEGTSGTGGDILIDYRTNDVAMTVLPNAPIDAATGLPVPTIAVAMDGGVSVIKDNGTVVSRAQVFSNGGGVYHVDFDGNGYWYGHSYYAETHGSYPGHAGIYSFSNLTSTTNLNNNDVRYDSNLIIGTGGNPSNPNWPNSFWSTDIDVWMPNANDANLGVFNSANGKYFSGRNGISVVEYDSDNTMYSNITSNYNTGYMVGKNDNVKLATLSDTDDADVIGTELVTNGTFDTDASGWQVGNLTTSVSSGELEVTTTQASHYMSQQISVQSGKTYTYSWRARRGTMSQIYMSVWCATTGSNIRAPYDYGATTSMASYSVTFTVPSNCTTINVYVIRDSGTTGTAYFDDFSLRLAEENRSANGNGLQVFGTVTKNPVATGADLVSYGEFNVNGSYLQQPYNSDYDFGTGDYAVSLWFKDLNYGTALIGRYSTKGWLLSISSGGGGGGLVHAIYTQGFTSSGRTTVGTSTDESSKGWQQAWAIRRSGVQELWLNGELIGATANTADLNDTSAVLTIGTYPHDTTSKAAGEFALVRVSATAPYPEQIKKIYEDEKVLFQENAQATLYGTSDAVTALAYDDSTNLLHAGTSAGRSVFQGLRRIDNTTDAVGSAISASNGMVAED